MQQPQESTNNTAQQSQKKDTRGGARVGSGRKSFGEKAVVQFLKERIEEHAGEEVTEVKVLGRGRKKTTEILKKARALHLLDTLYFQGQKGNVMAANSYLDRTLGKAIATNLITSKAEVTNKTITVTAEKAREIRKKYEEELFDTLVKSPIQNEPS